MSGPDARAAKPSAISPSRRGVRALPLLGSLCLAAFAQPQDPTPPALNPPAAVAAATGVAGLTPRAEAGEAEAQAALGDAYRQGDGVAADPKAARGWYEKAAKQKHPRAARVLGEMYAKGEGGRRNEKKAQEMWRMAEAAGDPLAPMLMADFLFGKLTGGRTPGPGTYAFKGGVPAQDVEVVAEWYREAQTRDPRPEARAHAEQALTVLASFRSAAQTPAK